MVCVVRQLPQTDSVKVDRNVVDTLPLHKAPSTDSQTGQAISLSEIEQTLLDLWKEVIPRDLIGHRVLDVESEFFQTGGNSLGLVDLQALIKEHLHISVPLFRLFESATLLQTAVLLFLSAKTKHQRQRSHDSLTGTVSGSRSQVRS
jgi:acyl carrier protein